jgi:hypothetical protein
MCICKYVLAHLLKYHNSLHHFIIWSKYNKIIYVKLQNWNPMFNNKLLYMYSNWKEEIWYIPNMLHTRVCYIQGCILASLGKHIGLLISKWLCFPALDFGFSCKSPPNSKTEWLYFFSCAWYQYIIQLHMWFIHVIKLLLYRNNLHWPCWKYIFLHKCLSFVNFMLPVH